MKALPNVLRVAACLLVLILARPAFAQGDEAAVGFENGPASFEVWADQRSNALSSGFLHTMQQGGFLSRELFEDMLAGHPSLGGMGGQVGWAQRGCTKPLNGTPWALSYALGSDVLISTLWRRDLMELTFIGNAPSLGEQHFWSGTGMRIGAFNRISVGVEHAETRQRIELSLVQRLAGAEWGIARGGFRVSEGADTMDVDVQAFGAASLDVLPDTTGLSFQDVLPAYGVGISGTLPWTSDVLPVQFVVNFRDIGVLFERPGGLYAAVDTGFTTTGLRVPFTSYFNQTGEEIDDLTWQDIAEGNAEISGDSIAFLTDSAARRTLLLPSRIHADLSWWPSERWQLRAQVHAGAWMPQPQLTAGFGWVASDRIALGADVRSGGWGGIRPVTWMRLRVSKRRELGIEIEDPLGLFWGSKVAAHTYGRGIRISLRRKPGQGWTQDLKGLEREAPRKAIGDDSIFGKPKVTP